MNERIDFAHVLNQLRVKPRFAALAVFCRRACHIDEADLGKGFFLG